MDGNAFRVVLQAVLATVALAVLSVPLNVVSRRYMLDALEDHVNRIYELVERIHEDFGVQEADRAGDDESGHSSSGGGDDDVDEVVASDRSSEEDTAESGNERGDERGRNSTQQSGTVVGGDTPTRDEVNINGELQTEPAAMRANCFLFENYDDSDNEDDKKESQTDRVVKQETPACEMADLMNLGTDDAKEYENVHAIVEVGTIAEEQLVVGSAVETRTTTGAEQSEPSNPKRKRAGVDHSSDSNADDEASGELQPAARKKSRVSGWTPINTVSPPIDPAEEREPPSSPYDIQGQHPTDPSVSVRDFAAVVDDTSVLRRSSRSNRGRRRANIVEDPELRRARDIELERTERERQERIRRARRESRG